MRIKAGATIIISMDESMARKIIVEVEVPEGKSIEEILRGVKYRVVEENIWDKISRVRRSHIEKLGGKSNIEEYRTLEEEIWMKE